MADSSFLAALLKARSRAWGGSFYSPVQSRQAAEALDSAIAGQGYLTSIGNQPIPHGAAFPGSPALNDQFFRTDLGSLYYYSGATNGWLQVGTGLCSGTIVSNASQAVTAVATLITFGNGSATLVGGMKFAGGKFTVPRTGSYLVGYSVFASSILASNGIQTYITSGGAGGSLLGGTDEGISNTTITANLGLGGSAFVSLTAGNTVAITGSATGSSWSWVTGDCNFYAMKVA